MKWRPIDVITAIIIVGCFVLLGLGKDSAVSWSLLGVVGAYYGVDLTPWLKIGKRHKNNSGGE